MVKGLTLVYATALLCSYIVPLTVITVTPGVIATLPFSVLVKVAAGTVIDPSAVAKAPVLSL